MKRIPVLVATVLTALLSTPALAQPPPARTCLRFGEIYSWKALDNRTVVVEDNRHSRFKLTTMGYCPNLAYRERIGFKSPGSLALSCMTPGDQLIVSQFGTGPQRCPISSIVAYTPAMEAADKAAQARHSQ